MTNKIEIKSTTFNDEDYFYIYVNQIMVGGCTQNKYISEFLIYSTMTLIKDNTKVTLSETDINTIQTLLEQEFGKLNYE